MQLLMMLYLVAMCSIIPLYMKQGYYELGEAKGICYIAVSLCFFMLFIFVYIISIRKKAAPALPKTEFTGASPIKLCLYATILSGIISFIFSADKKTAFWGIEGWRNGFLSLLLMVVFSLILSNLKRLPVWFICLAMLVPAFEFVLGIINRFGIYFATPGRGNAGYLATIGNINWYAGFLSVFLPLGIGIMYLQKPFSRLFFISGLYVIPGIVTLFLQGSDGAFLIVLSSYLMLLFYSLSAPDSTLLRKWLIQIFVLGMGMSIADIMVSLFAQMYTYDSNYLVRAIHMHIGIIIMAAAFFLYNLVRLLDEINVSFKGAIVRKALLIVLVLLSLAGIYLVAVNFSDEFGNGRGIIWRMCTGVFLGLSPWEKMVGVGRDCLYPYVINNPLWRETFLNVFNGDILTNAHCELLTVLIESGLIGVCAYLGLFISIFIDVFRVKERENAAIVCALPIISYFVYSQISFSQVTATPYVYILIGIYLAFSRKKSLGQLRDWN